MRKFSMLILLGVSLLIPASAFAQTWTDFQVGGLTRQALVYVPTGISNPPLLISLHGMGIGASWNQGEMMKFEPIADRDKFIVVYPEADQDLKWDLAGTHDIDFILKIIDDMSANYSIDLNRVYASGFSMGGMFSYTLACKIPEKIAAIAPGDGYPLGGEFGCVTTRSVPIFHMHGTADDFVAYSGIHSFLNTKVAAYGCPTTAVTTDPYPPSNASSQSFKEYWGPCTNSNGQSSEIILISVTGMIHDWATPGKANTNEDAAFNGKPYDIDGSEEAWAFLKTHSLADNISGSGGQTTGGMMGSGGVVATGGVLAGTGGVVATGGVLTGTGGVAATGGAPLTGVGGAVATGGMLVSGTGGDVFATGGVVVPAASTEASGCSCKIVRSSGSPKSSLGLALGLGLLLRHRGRRRLRAHRERMELT